MRNREGIESGSRFRIKDRFELLLIAGTTIGIATGIIIKNIPAASSLGMILGLISGLFTKIVAKN